MVVAKIVMERESVKNAEVLDVYNFIDALSIADDEVLSLDLLL